MDAQAYYSLVSGAMQRNLTAMRGAYLAGRGPQVDPEEALYDNLLNGTVRHERTH